MKENNNEQLEKILSKMAKEAMPDRNFTQTLKVKLRERYHSLYEGRIEEKWSFFKRRRIKIQFTSALVLMLFTSTTLYAYNSDGVTNGSILYPLKRTAENVEGMFAVSVESKTSYYNKMAVRRMRELNVLENKGIIDEETIWETANLLAKAEILAEEVPNEEIEEPVRPKRTPTFKDKKTNNINPAKVQSPDRKTKREKAIEEISIIRTEFQQKFDRKLFKTEIEITSPPLEKKTEKREDKADDTSPVNSSTITPQPETSIRSPSPAPVTETPELAPQPITVPAIEFEARIE